MKEIKKIAQAVRRQWYLVVGVRWQQYVQYHIITLYHRRVEAPIRFWRAFGCPEQLRPQLPWWQPLVWRWIVITRAFGPGHPRYTPRPRRRRA